MGDHTRREMIVRITRVVRQNPAYRPSAFPTSDAMCRRLFLFHHVWGVKIIRKSILILLAIGCTRVRVPTSQPTPTPAQPHPEEVAADNGPWNFRYSSDTVRLQISRSAIVESQTDTSTHREISTNNTHEVIELAVSDTIRYKATIDTFSTANQGLIGTVPPVSTPIQVAGILTDSIITSSDSTDSGACNPVRSSLESDVRNVLISFPREMSPQTSWQDSTTRTVCYGSVPMKATVIRRFTVVGRIPGNGTVLAVQRTDSISAHGEGRQQQHQLSIDVTGTGSAIYHLSAEGSALLHLATSQDLDFLIRASGHVSRFHETAKEEFSPVP